jgi:hypothetical protein
MPLSTKTPEIRRLIEAFENEARQFHDVRLGLFYMTQQGSYPDRKFLSPNHTIMLWQHYGLVGPFGGVDRFVENLQHSDMTWGVRGAELSCYAVIEGAKYDLFVRMASRAGSLFDEEEVKTIKLRIAKETMRDDSQAGSKGKSTAVSNSNPLAIWINFLLYHLSLANPGRERAHKIEPDPFSLSLAALERLAEEKAVSKIDRSSRALSGIEFKVAMSFPGEHRAYVAGVVNALRPHLGTDSVFYDFDYQAQLARPNLDLLLQSIYRDHSELVVVFLCEEYAQKEWCGLEWRAIRDIIKAKEDKVMFVRFDDEAVDGVFSIDGYIDARRFSEKEVAKFIMQRLGCKDTDQ